jgi:hypothetical protein
MSYTTKAKVENLLGGITIPASYDITTLIAWVKAFIDKYCGKTFEAASDTQYYDGNGRDEIITNSFVGTPVVTLLKTDGSTERVLTVSDSGDIITGPYNSTEKYLLKTTRVGYLSCFPNRQKCLKVVATFGASTTIPTDVEMAATQLVAELYAQKTNRGKLTEVMLGDYKEVYGQINEKAELMGVTQILDTYRDIEI